jgi:hypothetical protein
MPASVFWDFENCRFPHGMIYRVMIDVPFSSFSKAIKGLLSRYGLFAKDIHAIGHVNYLTPPVVKAFSEIGINMIDVLSHKPVRILSIYLKNASDMSILTEIAKVIFSHKPPHGMVLISGDKDFSHMLNFLDRVGYKVILVNDRPDELPKGWFLFSDKSGFGSSCSY